MFHSAVELPEEEREAFVLEQCRGDATLHARVLRLLAAHDASANFMATVALSPDTRADFAGMKTEAAGECIGPYRLIEQIGEGGFGVVWLAEQDRPVKRQVALKIIRLGMDTEEVIARFGQERQALAVMDHPNIAKVFDAGATPTGRPFFVMELVRGVKITEFCDENGLSTEQRLELFVQVCHAVQHAHQKGIIHRDLKPSNILVATQDGQPVPKVIDFGVAKATGDERLAEVTLRTRMEQMVGTPLYMSPEQAALGGSDIDTRSDIYSLGVLLYEMLTGRPPFDAKTLMTAGFDEMRRIIREVEPPRPSTRLITLADEELRSTARLHASEPRKLTSVLRGDLDWIVMKAIEKDRDTPLRERQRPGDGHPAAPAQRAGVGTTAEHRLPAATLGEAPQARLRRRFQHRRSTAHRHRLHDVAGRAGHPGGARASPPAQERRDGGGAEQTGFPVPAKHARCRGSEYRRRARYHAAAPHPRFRRKAGGSGTEGPARMWRLI